MRLPSGLPGCELSLFHFRRGGPRKRSSSTTRRDSPGSSISAASNCIRIQFAPATSSIPTSCESISIRCRASNGRMCAASRSRCKALLAEVGLRGWPKTSGSRGMHINVRIEPRWTFTEVRRAALALSRAVERRAPALASSKWWKEERHGVFLDYNQNAKDRTTCSAYSVRPLPDARVSTPLHWHEVPDCDPADFTVFTMPKRFAEVGDPHADMDAHPGSLEKLLELAARTRPPVSAMRPGRRTFARWRARRREWRHRALSQQRRRRRGRKMPLIVIANSPDKAGGAGRSGTMERQTSPDSRISCRG